MATCRFPRMAARMVTRTGSPTTATPAGQRKRTAFRRSPQMAAPRSSSCAEGRSSLKGAATPRWLVLAGIAFVACGGRVSIDADASPGAGGLPSVQPSPRSAGGTHAEGGHAEGGHAPIAGAHGGGVPAIAGSAAIGGGGSAALGGAAGTVTVGGDGAGGSAGAPDCSDLVSTNPLCDGDGDGVPDPFDTCILSAEDGLGPLPKDGCPDGDADGIPDDRDACRSKKEDGLPPNPTDGCPQAPARATTQPPSAVKKPVKCNAGASPPKRQQRRLSIVTRPRCAALKPGIASAPAIHAPGDAVPATVTKIAVQGSTAAAPT